MAETSKIEWCDSTFNAWIGCTKIAPACDFCYAADMAKRYGWVEWGNHPRKRTSAALWAGPKKWQRQAADFFAEHGRKRRVFCSSLADVFDNQVPPEWRADLWDLIRATPDLNWLLLTKRPQNIEGMLPAFWDDVKGHVWLGTTVENQKYADQNIPHLLKHDSAVRFISAEPLLGPIDLSSIDVTGYEEVLPLGAAWLGRLEDGEEEHQRRIDWVIAGGESGPHARPSEVKWFRGLRDQCVAAGVPFLFKQWGEWRGVEIGNAESWPDAQRFEWPSGAVNVRKGKKVAGRHLDGALHDGFPG